MLNFIKMFFSTMFFSKMYCGNCRTSTKFYHINVRKKSQLFAGDFLITTTAFIPSGLHIRPLICFKCNHVTEWAADQNNLSGNAIEGIEYFNNYRISQDLKDKTKEYAKRNNQHIALEKIEKIKIR